MPIIRRSALAFLGMLTALVLALSLTAQANAAPKKGCIEDLEASWSDGVGLLSVKGRSCESVKLHRARHVISLRVARNQS